MSKGLDQAWKQVIEDRILRQLALCEWTDEAQRCRVYSQFANAVKRLKHGDESSEPIDYDGDFKRAVRRIEGAICKANTLEEVKEMLSEARKDASLLATAESATVIDTARPSGFPLWRIFVGLALLTLAGLQAYALFAPPRPLACAADSTTCFDSGWQPVSNKASTTYFFRHNLGAVPREVTLWFSPTKDGARAFPALWKFPSVESGNPITIEARADAVYVNVWKGLPIHGVYDGTQERWTTYTDGFYRIVAVK